MTSATDPYFRFNVTKDSFAVSRKVISAMIDGRMMDTFDMELLKEFLKALANSAGLDLHVTLHYGDEIHHSIESIFKALGRAMSAAVAKDPRIKGILSTKGKL